MQKQNSNSIKIFLKARNFHNSTFSVNDLKRTSTYLENFSSRPLSAVSLMFTFNQNVLSTSTAGGC